MQLTQYNELWSKIENFQLDDPAAAKPFSAKLSAEQGWPPAYTSRVIKEYLKFIFLCCISPRGASPSHDVDMVWHLHLTYTKNYWSDFCKDTVGREIHHNPSAGGDQENHKHEQWYGETLELYEKVFGYAPASDIWPRENSNNSVLPEEPPMAWTSQQLIMIFSLYAMPFVVILIFFGKVNPYSLEGNQFLVFYPVLVICGLAGIYLNYQRWRPTLEAIVEQHYPAHADIFQTTKFLYGHKRAFQTGIVDLIRRNLLLLVNKKKFKVQKNGYLSSELDTNPLVPHLLLQTEGTELKLSELASWYKPQAFVSPGFLKLFLFSSKNKFFSLGNVTAVSLVSVGIVRAIQGVVGDHPSMFIVAMTIGTIFILSVAHGKFSRTSTIMSKARELSQSIVDPNKLHSDPVVSDFGLRGHRAVSIFSDGLVLIALFAAFSSPSDWRDSSSSGGCSSCSGAGSGGCGGDGGSGGGCGGCGGGGD